MPLSISSSNQRIPSAPYGKLWAWAVVILIVCATGMEVFLRNKGHLPSVTDSQVLWAMQMDRLKQDKPEVVLLGASRMALGLQVDHFQTQTGQKVVNASIDGSSPIPALQYLADRTDFNGLLMVSLSEDHIVNGWVQSKAEQWVRWYETSFQGGEKYNQKLNKAILNMLQTRLVIFSANCGFRVIERLNQPIYLQTMPSRSKRAYYREMLSAKELAGVLAKRLQTGREGIGGDMDRETQLARWKENASEVSIAVRAIQQRGGRVVLIRFPMSGEYARLFDRRYPKTEFWDTLAGLTGAEAIDFRDIPEFSDLDCPDGSHLNYDDALRVTAFLAGRFGE